MKAPVRKMATCSVSALTRSKRDVRLAFLFVLVLCFGTMARAQFPGMPGPFGTNQHDKEQDDPNHRRLEHKQAELLNAQRHKTMISDADKLLKLARELNDPKVHITPSERLQKIAEIEKLAHSVKEKMTFVVNGGPQVAMPIPQWPQ